MTRFEQFRAGLDIIGRYPDPQVYAEHDVIYAGHYAATSAEDTQKLIDLGWHEEYDSWAFFV